MSKEEYKLLKTIKSEEQTIAIVLVVGAVDDIAIIRTSPSYKGLYIIGIGSPKRLAVISKQAEELTKQFKQTKFNKALLIYDYKEAKFNMAK